MPDTVTCPVHNCALHPKDTQFGTRWACPVEGCTVCWWGEERTTPADESTRKARTDAHKAFDQLWKGPDHPMERADAYEWLQRTFELPPDKAHIGLFTKQQCEDLIYAVRRWMGKDRKKGD